jgi:hypothetical protein
MGNPGADADRRTGGAMVLTRGRAARTAAASVLAATALALTGCGGDDSFELQSQVPVYDIGPTPGG